MRRALGHDALHCRLLELGLGLRGALVLVCLSALLSVLGCVDDQGRGPLWADPGIARLSLPAAGGLEGRRKAGSAHKRILIEIHNRSRTPRPIGEFALGGEDWDTLRFVDDALPRTIPGLDSVIVELEVSPASFRSDPGVYRSGQASLSFSSDQFAYEVPIELAGSEVERTSLAALAVAVVALAGLVVLLTWVPLRRTGAGRQSARVPMALRAGVGGAFVGLLMVAAAIPVGLGICSARLGDLVGPRELAQCRNDLGGAELLALPASPGLWWWLISLAIATAMLTIVRMRSEHPPSHLPPPPPPSATVDHGPTLALAGLRLLGFALLMAALWCGLSPLGESTTELVLAQTGTTKIAGLEIPPWGLIAQPLGFGLALVLVASAGPRAHEPVVNALERFEQLVWSALLVTAFLGGPTIPGLSQRPVPLLGHGAQLAVELLAFTLELALIMVLAQRLRAYLEDQGLDTARLVHIHARWTLPLALLNLVGVLLWRIW